MSEASDFGVGPVAEGDGAGFLKKNPEKETLVGQQEALAKGSRALRPAQGRARPQRLSGRKLAGVAELGEGRSGELQLPRQGDSHG